MTSIFQYFCSKTHGFKNAMYSHCEQTDGKRDLQQIGDLSLTVAVPQCLPFSGSPIHFIHYQDPIPGFLLCSFADLDSGLKAIIL